MTYQEAITQLFTEHSNMPNNYLLKASFFTNVGILNTEDPSEDEGLQAALLVCNDCYWDFPSTNFANALDEIAKTVDPNHRPYPKIRT